MLGYFRALAADYDGTLSRNGRPPEPPVLASLARIRASGGLVLIVTGRILAELRAAFPDVEAYADVIVGENGCVLWNAAGIRLLTDHIDAGLETQLRRRGVPIRSGQVILAGSAVDRVAVLEEVRARELDCQLVFNRSELMILPSGVTKGTGLFDALGDLGVSSHSTIGLGDAENDRALLDTCEVGVAAGGAVASVAAFADRALPDSDPATLAALLDGLFDDRQPAVHSRRRQLRLGVSRDQEMLTIPSSQMNILICGATGSGKSYLAGLCAEGLISLGYSVLVIDPEGDHQGLGTLRGVVVIDGADGLPSPERVVARFSQRFMSVVLDISTLSHEERRRYLSRLASAVDRSRTACGLPHWIVDDEAHTNITEVGAGSRLVGGDSATGRWGFCLATFRPDLLDSTTLASMDAVVVVGSDAPVDANLMASMGALTDSTQESMAARVGDLAGGEAYLAQRSATGRSGRFRIATRVTEHHRHWHKYTDEALPRHRRFYFRDGNDQVVAVAENLRQLAEVVLDSSEDVVEHHLKGRDISAWIRVVFADRATAEQVGDIEDAVADGRLSVNAGRVELALVLRREYGL